MTIPETTAPDVVTDGLLSLVPPFWGKPRIASFLVAFLNEVQRLEDAISQTMLVRDLANADAERLRVIGAIVGEPAYGRDPERHRAGIAGRILANRSTGKIREMIAIIRAVLGASAAVAAVDVPTDVLLTILSPLVNSRRIDIDRLVQDASGAGVGVQIAYRTAGTPLTLAGTGSTLATVGLGHPGSPGGVLGFVWETP